MKKVLIIDDKATELERAKEAALKLGLEPIVVNAKDKTEALTIEWSGITKWMTLIPTVDLVVTDLMWEVREGHGQKVNGLLVTILAKHFNVPVGLCTDGNDYANGHHDAAISFINDSFIGGLESAMWIISGENEEKMKKLEKNPPFVWNTRKNWEDVMTRLTNQIGSN